LRKVIGFDSWTGGAGHFARLIPALEAMDFQLRLVHLGSWGNEPGCPNECLIGELLVRDISFYGGDSLEKILDIEQPCAVILLSTDTFAHRALIRYCKQRGIPTLNLYHGLVKLTDVSSKDGPYTVSYSAHARYVLSRLGKLFKHTLPCYIRALFKTKAKASEWTRFFLDLFHMAKNDHFYIVAAPDAKTTKCAVYTEADVEHAIYFYGFAPEDVFIVGNPDLLHFGFNENMLGGWVEPTVEQKSIMYIETGFSSLGLFFSNERDYIDHLIRTSVVLGDHGFRMMLKLKPHASNIESLQQKLKISQIELVDNKNFMLKLMTCSASIVETTTLAMVPALIGMPIFLAKYGHLDSLDFGPILTSYPHGCYLKNVSDISTILEKDAQTRGGVRLTQWLDLNAGPMPPEAMPKRVADIIEKMT
jgi:hypothetical protein